MGHPGLLVSDDAGGEGDDGCLGGDSTSQTGLWAMGGMACSPVDPGMGKVKDTVNIATQAASEGYVSAQPSHSAHCSAGLPVF